jgi:hypothetical protein
MSKKEKAAASDLSETAAHQQNKNINLFYFK